MDPAAQIRYQVYVTMTWISYFLAIKMPAGSPPKNFEVPKHHWKKWCKKCENYKPERAHHCRKCNMCVLQMDHHCPWTNNCVGHDNFPHFMRFLVWVMISTSVTLYELGLRAYDYYVQGSLPAYLIDKKELTAVIILLPLDAFVLFAVLMLFLKCLLHVFSGKTQIEVWEMERIESQFHTERFWRKIRHNYQLVHGKEMPLLTSWNYSARQYEMAEDDESDVEEDFSEDPVVPVFFTPDDLVFPYDLGMWSNLTSALGSPWLWPLPWGRAKGNGYVFPHSDDDDQLNLPWPPDGGNMEFEARDLTDAELRRLGSISLIKKHLDPRSKMGRSQWINEMGESLTDYGVDVDAEQEKGLAR